MKKIILLLVLLAVVYVNMANAQQSIPNIAERDIAAKSPNVAPMFNIVDCPVSYFNGTANVNIPLCQVEACGITLPISLSYASTGLRPSQEASWVGLGWNLSLNACISRTVKCFDDFREYDDFFNSGQQYSGYYDTVNYARKDYYANCAIPFTNGYPELALVRDSEPDIYCVSLWNGGDKFIFNKDPNNGNIEVVFTDKSNGWKIKVLEYIDTDNKKKHYFELTDKDGTIYEFRQYEQTYIYGEKGEAKYISINTISSLGAMSHYNSSWFLTKIKAATCNDSIMIDYEDEYYYGPAMETCYKYNEVSIDEPYTGFVGNNGYANVIWYEHMPTEYTGEHLSLGANPYYTWNKTMMKTKRIKEIRWNNGKIRFDTSEREDLYYRDYYRSDSLYYMKKLDGIKVLDSKDNVVHAYKFHYGYFSGTATNDYLTKRLRLERIVDCLDSANQYTFDYYDGNFPSKQTTMVDYWGYYNGKDYGDKYYCSTQLFGNSNTMYISDGANKTSNYDNTVLGLLKSITYPTGGKENFEYELNRFNTSVAEQDGGRLLATYEGLEALSIPYVPAAYAEGTKIITLKEKSRLEFSALIHAVNHNNEYGPQTILLEIFNEENDQRVYDYYSPTDIESKKQSISLETGLVLDSGTYRIVARKPSRENWACRWTIKVYDPRPVSYIVCDKEMSGNGLRIKSISLGDKVRNFTYSNGKLTITPLLGYKKGFYNSSGNWLICYIQTSQSCRSVNSMSHGYSMGYKTVTETVGNKITEYSYRLRDYSETTISSDPSQMTNPFFENGLLVGKSVQGLYTETYNYLWKDAPKINAFAAGTGNIYDFGYYSIKWWYPNSRRITQDGVTVTESYTYNDDMMIKSIQRSSDGQTTTENIVYSSELNDNISKEMKDRNIIVPMETSKFINGILAAKNRTGYRNENGLILPSLTEQYDLDKLSYREHVKFDKYDNNGNPLQITRDGIPSVYIWGYSNEYPVAEISNMTYQDLLKYIPESSLTSIANAKTQSSNHMAILANLQKSIATNRLCSSMTIYTYKPLVGITSQIAPNGLTTCYEYDSSGRLIETAVKTADGKKQTLNKYQYNYKGVQK